MFDAAARRPPPLRLRHAFISRGKDFVQLRNGPFDLDLVFAPDGIERFEDRQSARRALTEGPAREEADTSPSGIVSEAL